MCPVCRPKKKNPDRPGIYQRYGKSWKRIREMVLRDAGIPEEEWGKYQVDHRPPYDPDIEPDHMAYTLVPMLIEDHGRKTAQEEMDRDRMGRFKGRKK